MVLNASIKAINVISSSFINSGNPRRHIEVLKSLVDKPCSGEPSLQNSLELVTQTLKNMPSHTSRLDN